MRYNGYYLADHTRKEEVRVPTVAISKQKSLPPFVFLEAIRHIRHFLNDKVFKETLCIP